MMIMHGCFPVKSPNYVIAEAPSYPLLKLPFKGTGYECRRVECKSARLWGEMVKELSDGVTETQILQKIWKK